MDAIQIGEHIIVGASILHSFLPPWDFLSDYPRAQKAYKLVIYVIGYVALNARSSLYPALSTKDGTITSQITKTNGGGGHDVAQKDRPST